MIYRFLLLSSVFGLGACAYIVDRSYQDLTVLTPGAENTLCYVMIDGLKYKFYPPQTISVTKSRKDMTVDCLAPGNRRKKVTVESGIEGSVVGNVVTGVVPGVAWDATSESMFNYPDTIVVDFTNVPWQPEALPAHNNPNLKQPEEYDLEEFRPSRPRMNSDRYETEIPLVKRGSAAPAESRTQTYSDAPPDKGDLMNVLDHLFDGPRTTTSAPANNGPAYPGD